MSPTMSMGPSNSARMKGGLGDMFTASVFPKALESVRRHLGIPHRMGYVLMAQVLLQRSSVVSLIGQLEAAAVAQHVGMDRKGNPRGQAATGCQLTDIAGGHRSLRSRGGRSNRNRNPNGARSGSADQLS